MNAKKEIEALSRGQLLSALGEVADDVVLRWIVLDAMLGPLRSSFAQSFGKCDRGGCHKMALYSGIADRGGYPLRCPEHKATSDSGVPFADQLAKLAEGMKFS